MKFGYCHNKMQHVMASDMCCYFCFQTLHALIVPKSALNPDVFSICEKPTVGLCPIAQYQLTVNWFDVQLYLSWGEKCDQNCSSLVTNKVNSVNLCWVFKNQICDTYQKWHFSQICIEALLSV